MKPSNAVELFAIPGIPLVRKDDDLVALIGEGLARGGIVPRSLPSQAFRWCARTTISSP